MAPSMMNSRGTAGIEAPLDQVVDQRLHHRGVLGCPLDQPERMLVARRVDPDRRHQDQILLMWMPSICTTRRSSAERSDAIHSCMRAADSATKWRETADFDTPAPRRRRNIALGQPHRSAELAASRR